MAEGTAAADPGVPEWTTRLVDRLRRGDGTVDVLAGGSRSVRRRMTQDLVDRAREHGWQTLEIRPWAIDSEVPFGALQSWLDALAGTARKKTASLPFLFVSGVPEASELVSSPPAPEEVRASLWELLESATRRAPLVCAVEDAELLDPVSLDWIGAIAEHPTGVRTSFLLSLGGPAPPSLRERVERPTSSFLWHPLSPPGSLEHPAEDGEEPPPPDLRELELSVLRGCALAGPDASPEVLGAALGLPSSEVAAVLVPRGFGGTEGLARVPRGWLRGLERSCPPKVRQDLHLRLAHALEARGPPRESARLCRTAEHWAAAGITDPGVARLIAAALACERWGSPALAERRLQRAILLAQGEPSVHGRELEESAVSYLALLKLRSEEAQEALPLFRRALGMAERRGARAAVWVPLVAGLARARTLLGEDPEPDLQAAIGRTRGKEGDLTARLLRSYSFFLTTRGRPEESIRAAEEASALAERGKDRALQARCWLGQANAYLYSVGDPERARPPLSKVLAHADQLRETPEAILVVFARDRLALLESSLGHPEEARRKGEEAVREARAQGNPWSLLTVLGNLVEYTVKAGDLPRAQELVREFRDRLERAHVPATDENHLQLLLDEGELAQALGAMEKARARYHELAASAEKGGVRYFLAQALVLEANAAAATGDVAGKNELLQRVRREGLGKTLGPEHQKLLEDLRSSSGP